jgi:hypothetical protein
LNGNINVNRSTLVGGADRSMPTYKEPKNSPFITNEEKEVRATNKNLQKPAESGNTKQIQPSSGFDKNQEEFWEGYKKADQSRSNVFNKNMNNIAKTHDAKNPLQPIFSLEMYDPTTAKPKPPEPNAFMPIAAPPFTYIPQYYGNGMMPPYTHIPNYQIPVNKIININASGNINANHQTIFDVYEEYLPTKDVANTPNTLGERLNMYQYTRSVFVKQGDGEDIDLTGNSVNSLIKHIKTIELNPHNPNMISDNPYMGLPDNMLTFKACWPIKYNPVNNTTQCSPVSLGLMVKIYGLSIAEFQTRNIENQEYYKFDTWREVAFYEYIREEIIKTKTCPNFVVMHAYFIAIDCPIDFVKINMLKNKRSDISNYFIGNQVIRQPSQEFLNYFDRNVDLTVMPVLPYLNRAMTKEGYFRMVKPIVDNNMFLKNYSGKALVMLTEAPTYNLLDWASKKYRKSDNFKVHEMVNSGFHDSSIWKSIIFQIMAALCTLQIHKISFTNFSVIDNIYIQDSKTHPNNTMHWKYIINGIEYFVPNYGFVVLIDSNFKDIKSEYSTNPPANKVYKINSSIFDDVDNNIISDPEKLQEDSIKAFLSAIDPNVFSGSFATNGGTKPPEDILRLLININNDVNNTYQVDKTLKLSDVIYKHCQFFINNRIGTILKVEELTNIQKTNTEKFKKGQIIVREFRPDTFDFVLFKEYVDDSTSRILTDLRTSVNKKQMVELTVDNSSIYNYSIYEKVNQDYVNKINFNVEHLLETYVINDA